MNVGDRALEHFSIRAPSAEVFFLPVNHAEEHAIGNEIDEFISELNGEVVEMNLDARRILTTANTPASRHKYAAKQAEYIKWLEKEGVDACQPNTMINYAMVLNDKYSPESLWSTHSILKKRIVHACAADENPKVKLMGVGIGVSYFGLLHKKEILLGNVKDTTFNTEENVYQ
eukprot:2899290-Ditylum_brightwellii.AAC.1